MDQIIENSFAAVDLDENKDGLGAFALYTNRKEADMAVKALERNGFAPSDISLLAPLQSGHRDFVYHQTPSLLQGTLIGALIGLVVLGFVGFLFGSKEVATNSYNFDPFGHESSMLTSIAGAIVGMIFGAACGALVGIGSPKSAAKRYGFYLKEGGIVLVVHLKNAAERLRVSRILEKTRGQDISVLEEAKIWSTIIPEKKRLVFH